MTKVVQKVDPYGELVDLAVELVQDLAMTQLALLANGMPVEKTKELAHAIDLAARIQEKTLALAKANWRRGPRTLRKSNRTGVFQGHAGRTWTGAWLGSRATKNDHN